MKVILAISAMVLAVSLSGPARAGAGQDGVPAAPSSGTVQLTDTRFHVQEKVSFEWVYDVGPGGFGLGDTLVLRDPVFHGMRWSKWGDLSPYPELCTPQSTAQRASWGLVHAYVTRDDDLLDDVTVSVDRSNCQLHAGTPSCTADIHEDTDTTLYLDSDISLVQGDAVHLVVGDVDGCWERCEDAGEGDCSYCDDCGFEMPDRAFPEIIWTAQECLGGTCVDLSPPTLEVSANATVNTVLVTVPSQAVVDEPFRVKVALLDRWGNAIGSAARTLTLDLQGADADGDGQTYTLSPTDEGWHDFQVTVHSTGVYRFSVGAGGEDLGGSNPVQVFATAPEYSIYWGDIHVHHGLTWTDGDGYRQDLNHNYARDVVGDQVVAESQKAAGIEIDEDALWAELEDNCSSYTVEGEYLVLLGFEWMGDIASREFGWTTEGHHNVYYDTCEAPFGTHDTDVIRNVDGELGLWPWVDAVRQTYGVDAVTIPHAMRWTGYNYDVAYPGVQTLAEIYSEWGDNTTWAGAATAADKGADEAADAGTTQDMLRRGLRLGWIGGSDNHDGWMGNPFSEKNASSGLAAFVSPALTRADVFDAMKSRRTYATTGNRPILRFQAEDGDAVVQQGGEYLAQVPTLRWEVYATAPIEKLRVYSMDVGGQEQREVYVEEPDGLDVPDGFFQPDWDGRADRAWWLEIIQADGEKAWSSPIWVTADCDRLDVYATDPLSVCDGGSNDDTGAGDTGSGEPPPGRRCQCATSGAGGALVLSAWLGLLALARRRRD